jgi:formate hydrogenlyase subunit 3/multisubunit Na+/H+ antiporter MnhD subunit
VALFAVFYLVCYTLGAVAAFGAASFLCVGGRDASSLDQIAGLSRRRPFLALVLTLSLLHLAGIPPTAGFAIKAGLLMFLFQEGFPVLAWIAVAGSVLGIAYVWSRTFEQLARANILGIWPFYALSVGAVFLLRRSPGAPQAPYRTIGYPIVPVLFLLASLAMIGNSLVRQPQLTLFGFGIILSGVPGYYVWKRVKGD